MVLRYAFAVVLLAGSFPAHLAAQQTPADMGGGKPLETVTPQRFRWLRVITPPRRAPLSEACVVLDADVFSHAAPALRDLRLYQDGAELPYVVEQSFDERALESGTTPADDRSLYETSATGLLQPRSAGGTAEDTQFLGATIQLAEHVPVERVRLEAAPEKPAYLGVRAAITVPSLLGGGAEAVQGAVDAAHLTVPFTIGADLQAPAEVTLLLAGHGLKPVRAFLEMRRRSLCYHPVSASALTLYLGGGDITAEAYPFARTFQSDAERPAAGMGPLLPNPEFHAVTTPHWKPTRRQKLLAALALFVTIFFFNASRLFGKRQRLPTRHNRIR